MKEKELIELKLRRAGSSTLFEIAMMNELMNLLTPKRNENTNAKT